MSAHPGARREDSYALAIDLGTGSLKVGVVSLAGEVAAVEEESLETERAPGGAATQDAGAWWGAVRRLSARLLERVPPERVRAVASTGQWASTVPVDELGEPVGPCLMWQDTRGAEHAHRVVGGPLAGYAPRALATWIRHTSGIPSRFGGDPVSHMLHLERDDPHTARASRWYLEPVDYLSMRFVGRPAATLASMSAAWLTDNRRLGRLEYDPVLVKRIGLPPHKLPPLAATGAILGTVRDEVARELGLSRDVQVVTGVPDLHSAALGAGTVEPGQAHITISTSAWISLPVTRKKTDPIRSIATVPGLDDGSYLVANNQEAAGLCLWWLRETMAGWRERSFDELTALAAQAEPGSGGVLFTPWLSGERSPVDDRNARAGWHNLSARTTQSELVRALLEGVAYNARWLHAAVERFAGRRLDRLRIFGGGAQSDLWCQIYADVLDRTIERVAEPVHANLRGAALLTALALGAVGRGEIRELVAVDRVFEPTAANRQVYDRLYAEFPRLYRANRRTFARLNARP